MERAAAAIWDGGPGPWFGMVHHLGAALTELGLDGAQASGPVAVVPLSQRGLLGALDDVDDLLCRIIVTTRATERRLSCGRARTQLDLCRDVLAELPS
jgi:hypothetical protein